MRYDVALFVWAVCAALPAAGANCDDLTKLAMTAVTISSAQAIPAGAYTPPTGPAIPDMPAFCRVAGVIKPTNDSIIQFEVWMPSSAWNGKFQEIGNWGFAGSIS